MNYWQRLERLAMHSEQEIGEILNYICLETVFWTLRYIQLFVQKFRNRKGILSYNIEDKFKIRNSKSLWV